jgi:hypothetical protein
MVTIGEAFHSQHFKSPTSLQDAPYLSVLGMMRWAQEKQLASCADRRSSVGDSSAAAVSRGRSRISGPWADFVQAASRPSDRGSQIGLEIAIHVLNGPWEFDLEWTCHVMWKGIKMGQS